MFHWFYALPIWQMITVCLVGAIAWGLVGRLFVNKDKRVLWIRICLACTLLYAVVIAHETLIGRNGGSAELILAPLNNFVEAREQPEMYRSMLANVCLFVPLGAFVGSALAGSEGKFAVALKTRNIIAFTAIIGLAVSLVIEIVQYAYGLGRAEVDDLLCNTVGMLVGSLSILVIKKF